MSYPVAPPTAFQESVTCVPDTFAAATPVGAVSAVEVGDGVIAVADGVGAVLATLGEGDGVCDPPRVTSTADDLAEYPIDAVATTCIRYVPADQVGDVQETVFDDL